MARLKATHEGGSRFTVTCRLHAITVDQPVDNGGEDKGMTPPEIMGGSLARCLIHATLHEQSEVSVSLS